jgi:YcxB-like protein
MRVVYAIAYEDFLSLQRPFTLRPGRNAGFIAALAVCALVVGLGFVLGGIAGVVIGALGIFGAVGAWLYEKAAVKRAQGKHQKTLSDAYQGIHCRDKRSFQADKDGFTTACKCGVITRPWNEFVSVGEVPKFLLVGTRKGTELIPKSAFGSDGELTEFRSLLLGKLNQIAAPMCKNFEVSYTAADFRSAHWLHVWKAGGRSRLIYSLISAWGVAVIIYFLLTDTKSIDVEAPTARIFAFIGAVLFWALPAISRLRSPKFLPARIYYDSEGMLVVNTANRIRFSWDQFIGYLENKQVLLLYLNPRQYRLIPKRVLAGRPSEFYDVMQRQLRPYNHKNLAPSVSPSPLKT